MPKRTDIKKIMLIGSGPIVIGQGCEFDYSGVQACKVLRREGFEVVLVNSNPIKLHSPSETVVVGFVTGLVVVANVAVSPPKSKVNLPPLSKRTMYGILASG